MAKVSKNQRTNRGGQPARKMAKLVLAEKKQNGNFSFRTKIVDVENVQSELKAAKS